MKVRLKNDNIMSDYGRTLLRNRGVQDIDRYLNPDTMCLNSPINFENIDRGINLLQCALKNHDDILLIVDSDCDGFTSSTIMYQYIKKINPTMNIVYRLHEGKQHGLEDHIDWILEHEDEFGLIIIPDAGSNDKKYCEQLTIPVLILDHHITDEELAPNMCVINNQLSSKYSNKELTGAGVAWQFCRYYDNQFDTNYADNLIDLAAWGIVGDMGSLLDLENRWIVKNGLERVNNYFFHKIIEKQDFSMKGEITPITVAFYVVPLINAMIRVGTMEEKERLFMAFIDGHQIVPSGKRGHIGEPEEVAVESARECTNARARQNKILDEMVHAFEIKAYKYDLLDNKVLFIRLEDEDNYPAVLNGLCAMKLSAKFKKPTIVARLNDEGYNRGSMRGLNQSELESFKDFLNDSGYFEYVFGHNNAAGCSIKDKDLSAFHNYANQQLANIDFGENIYDVDFSRRAVESDIADIIADLDQYKDLWGQGTTEPYIHVSDINITKSDVQIMGKNADTVKIVKNGVAYMKFHAKDLIQELAKYDEIKMEIVGRPNLNEWMGNYTPQIFIENYQISDGALEF